MQIIEYSSLKKQVESRRLIAELLKQYENCFNKKTGVVLSKTDKDGFVKLRKELIDAINNALIGKFFSGKDRVKLSRICLVIFKDTKINTTKHIKTVKELREFEDDIVLDVAPELALKCLTNAKKKFDDFCKEYNDKGFSRDLYVKFTEELDVFLGSETPDAKSLYKKLRTLVMGLYQLYTSDRLEEKVVKNIINEINEVLDTYIDKFQKIVDEIKANGKECKCDASIDKEDKELCLIPDDKTDVLIKAFEKGLKKEQNKKVAKKSKKNI